MKLQIIIASPRPGRVGPVIGDWVTQQAKAHGGFDVEVTDLAELGLPFLDEAAHPMLGTYEHEHTKRWSETVAGSDAFVLSSRRTTPASPRRSRTRSTSSTASGPTSRSPSSATAASAAAPAR